MLRILRRFRAGVEPAGLAPGWRMPDDAVWIDLLQPTREEELAVEQALGLDLPTREEMSEIEPSSRLYREGGTLFMTAAILTHAQSEFPVLAPVTFVLSEQRLVTIRYDEPSSFKQFASQFEAEPCRLENGGQVFLGLLEAVVDRAADIVEGVADEVDEASQGIFRRRRRGGYGPVLTQLGRAQMVSGKARASLASLARVISFATLAEQLQMVRDRREHLRSLQRDVQSLTDHAAYVSANITFLLDAALGLINIEQNAIGKSFSVITVLFLPATLIASIYGMNFEHMPELAWLQGYPMALGMMALSMLAGFSWFKWKGWL